MRIDNKITTKFTLMLQHKNSKRSRGISSGYQKIKNTYQLWTEPIKPLSYISLSVLGPSSETTFITQTSLFFSEAANDPRFAFMSIMFLKVSDEILGLSSFQYFSTLFCQSSCAQMKNAYCLVHVFNVSQRASICKGEDRYDNK